MFKPSNGYMCLDAWVMSSVIQLATSQFCEKFLDRKIDPCGRQFDQMTQAARSGQANIAEGISRGVTSKETEMKLLDVARASLAELTTDYTFLLMRDNLVPWASDLPEATEILRLDFDKPEYGKDWNHDSCEHVLRQKQKFNRWLESDDKAIVANAVLILIRRCINAINHLLVRKSQDFAEHGGFSEKLYQLRSQTKITSDAKDAPKCPKCGAIMTKRIARKGSNIGHPFWSCSSYPNCDGTRRFDGPTEPIGLTGLKDR